MKNTENVELEKILEKFKPKISFAGPSHAVVKQVAAIQDNSKPNPEKLFVSEGIWAHVNVQNYNLPVKSFVFCPEYIYSPESMKLLEAFLEIAEKSYTVSSKVFDKISERDKPDGLISLSPFPQYTLDDIQLKEKNLIVILDGIEIPGNFGTIVRSSDGAGVDGVIICNRKVRLTHPKVIKSSLGACFNIPVLEVEAEQLIKWLRSKRFKIFLTDTDAEKDYYEVDYGYRAAIIAGSERYGISKDWYNEDYTSIAIPMFGNSDSLNVGIATTMVLYEASLSQKGLKNGIRR